MLLTLHKMKICITNTRNKTEQHLSCQFTGNRRFERIRPTFTGLEIQNTKFLKMAIFKFQLTVGTGWKSKILYLRLWKKLKMVLKQLYGGGRCLELHVQDPMSACMLLIIYTVILSKPSAGKQRVLRCCFFHNTENAAPTFINMHLPADDTPANYLLCKKPTKNCIQHICCIVFYLVVD